MVRRLRDRLLLDEVMNAATHQHHQNGDDRDEQRLVLLGYSVHRQGVEHGERDEKIVQRKHQEASPQLGDHRLLQNRLCVTAVCSAHVNVRGVVERRANGEKGEQAIVLDDARRFGILHGENP